MGGTANARAIRANYRSGLYPVLLPDQEQRMLIDRAFDTNLRIETEVYVCVRDCRAREGER